MRPATKQNRRFSILRILSVKTHLISGEWLNASESARDVASSNILERKLGYEGPVPAVWKSMTVELDTVA